MKYPDPFAYVKMNSRGSCEVIQDGLVKKTFGHVNPAAYSDANRYAERLNVEISKRAKP